MKENTDSSSEEFPLSDLEYEEFEMDSASPKETEIFCHIVKYPVQLKVVILTSGDLKITGSILNVEENSRVLQDIYFILIDALKENEDKKYVNKLNERISMSMTNKNRNNLLVSADIAHDVINVLKNKVSKVNVEKRKFITKTLAFKNVDGSLDIVNDKLTQKDQLNRARGIVDDITRDIASYDRKLFYDFKLHGYTQTKNQNNQFQVKIRPRYQGIAVKTIKARYPMLTILESGRTDDSHLPYSRRITIRKLKNGSLEIILPESIIKNESNACKMLDSIINYARKRDSKFSLDCLIVTNYLGSLQPTNVTQEKHTFARLPTSIQNQTHLNAFTITIKPAYVKKLDQLKDHILYELNFAVNYIPDKKEYKSRRVNVGKLYSSMPKLQEATREKRCPDKHKRTFRQY